MKKVTILIVDDHKIVRDGIRSLIENEEHLVIVGEAANGKEAIDAAESITPDLIIMDINMPQMDGIEATRAIKKIHPSIKVLALTMVVESYQIRNMIEAGASGYILKSSNQEELINAITEVDKGNVHFSDEATKAILEEMVNPNLNASKNEFEITDREKDVLKLIVDEFTNQEIADKLFISVRTVDAHRRNLLQKIGAKNTAGLVKYAIENGIFK